MGKKILSLLACIVLSAGMALAQNRVVTGTVIDAETGEPLPGASVKLQGTSTGAVTDNNGNFVLKNVPLSIKKVVVSFMGMETVEASIRNKMTITMTSDSKALEELMVVAYGKQSKSSFTGSAAIVGADEIAKVSVTNAIDALKGKAAGVQINTATGQPGSTPQVRIRGFNSLVSGMEPLYVVDGSPFSGSLNDINPNDIESMSVLKDAASTALYGARGGNGVILITTKSGKKHKDATINFEAKWGSNMKGSTDYHRITDPRGYYETYYQGLFNYAKTQLGKTDPVAAWRWANDNIIDNSELGLHYNVYNVPQGQALIGQNGKINPNATLGNVVTGADGNQYLLVPDNWDDEIYHRGLRQQYSLSASGASDKGGYYASFDYLNNEGITYASDYERFSARVKADYMLKKWLRLNTNLSYNHFSSNSMDSEEGNTSVGNPFYMHNIAPIYPIFYRDAEGNILTHQASGLKGYDYGGADTQLGLVRPQAGNPVGDLLANQNRSQGNSFNGDFSFDAYITKHLTFTSINNIFFRESRSNSVTNPWFGQYAANKGMTYMQNDRRFVTNFQQRLNWHRQFGKHDVEAMVGHEYFRRTTDYLYAQKNNMFSQDNTELNGAVVLDRAGSSLSKYNTEQILMRAMYVYDERYTVMGSYVRQASSVFHPDHRWGNFWSASTGWMITKEKFMEKTSNWLDELKFKLSYGQNGNDDVYTYMYTNRYDIVNSNNNVSLVPSTTGKNENLSWETSSKFNTGFDFSLFRGRLTGGLEYYNNKTSGLISYVPYAPSYGYQGYYDNIGNMRNQGFELSLSGDVIRTKDLNLNIYANISTNQNRVTELADERKIRTLVSYDPETNTYERSLGYTSSNYAYTEGRSRYTYSTAKYAGVYNENTWTSTFAPGELDALRESDPAKYQKLIDDKGDPSQYGKALYYKTKYKLDAEGSVMKDENGMDMIEGFYTTTSGSDADSYMVCDVLPKAFGGFGLNFSYKGLDLSLDFQYQLGGKVYDSEYASLMSLNNGYGFHKDLLNAWSENNASSTIPRLNPGDSYTASRSDRFLTSASCLTFGNFTFGYTLPKQWTRKAYMDKVRVYVSGDNLYTWSARSGLDPRLSVEGEPNGLMYAPMRTINGGVQITF